MKPSQPVGVIFQLDLLGEGSTDHRLESCKLADKQTSEGAAATVHQLLSAPGRQVMIKITFETRSNNAEFPRDRRLVDSSNKHAV